MYCGNKGHFADRCPEITKNKNNIKTHQTLATVLLDKNNKPVKMNHPPTPTQINSIIGSSTNNTNNRNTIDVDNINSESAGSLIHQYVLHMHARELHQAPVNNTFNMVTTPFLVKSIESHLLTIRVRVQNNGKTLSTVALIDSGATTSFIDSKIIEYMGFSTVKNTDEDFCYRLADNTVHKSRDTIYARMGIYGTNHEESITLKQLDNAAYPVILGKDFGCPFMTPPFTGRMDW